MKKILALLIVSLVPLISAAVWSDINVVNFYGDYVEPYGKGKAKSFLSESNHLGGIPIEIEKISNQEVSIKYNDNIVSVEGLPESLFDMKQIQWDDFNIDLKKESILLKLNRLSGKSATSETSITNLIANCNVSRRGGDTNYEDLIANCVKQGDITLSSLINNNPRKDSILSVFFYHSMNFPLASDVTVTDFEMATRSSKFTLSTHIKSGLSANIKMSGGIWYLSNTKEVKIRLDKAKAGFISIKNKVFKELESSSDPKLRVSRPYIFYEIAK